MRFSFTKIVLVVLALIVGVGVGLYLNHQNSLSQLTFSGPSTMKVSLYKDRGGDVEYDYDRGSTAVVIMHGSETTQILKGKYIVVVDNPKQEYINPNIHLNVQKERQTFSVSPDVTPQKLSSLLIVERPAIQKAMGVERPIIPKRFNITNESLYKDGSWYAAVLRPKEPQKDSYKIVLHKDGGSWKIAAEPDISIGKPAHSNIPPEVLDSLDKISY